MSLYDDASLIMYPSGVKSGKIYSQKPTDGTGDLTFTRASTATRVNSSGLIEDVASGVPRIDYTGGGCGKLLLEPQRTNVFPFSEDFSDASWVKTNVTVSTNDAISPDGSINASSLIETSANSEHFIDFQYTTSGGNYYSFSCFIKATSSERYVVLGTGGTNSAFATFDIVNGQITGAATTSGIGWQNPSANIEPIGNGWYRCSISAQDTIGTSSRTAVIALNNVSTNPSDAKSATYTGDGTSGVYIWGAQLEQGSYPTSYIPTAGATATRLADVASQSGISTLIGQTEGTILVDVNVNEFLLGEIISIRPDVSNKIEIYTNPGGDIYLDIVSSGVNIVKIATGLTNGRFKIGVGYKSGDTSFYLNGSLVSTNSSSVINLTSTLDSIGVSNRIDGSLNANIDFNSFQLMKTRVTDAELATLTTL